MRSGFIKGIFIVTVCLLNVSIVNADSGTDTVSSGGGIRPVSSFILPPSELMSKESKANLGKDDIFPCPFNWRRVDVKLAEVKAWRQCLNKLPLFDYYAEKYDVEIHPQTMAGVYTDIVLPANGISKINQNRVLISLHGGAFLVGARTNAEARPIAEKGKIKVVSVDYRMAPEHHFPAATEDVAAVYKELLKKYLPENIGIYGCSAGGILVAQSLAWFQAEGLPTPGAAGMFCAGAHELTGDLNHFVSAYVGWDSPLTLDELAYYQGASLEDPLVVPGKSPVVLKKFPPSLLISSTRDYFLSSVVFTHSELTRLGVDADLHIWEGLEHGFLLNNPEFPESQQAYDVIVKFFDRHLDK